MSLVIQILIVILLLAAIALLIGMLFVIMDWRDNTRSLNYILKEIERKLPTILDSLEQGSNSFKGLSTSLEKDLGSIAKIIRTILKIVPTGTSEKGGGLFNKSVLYTLGMGLGFGLWEGVKKKIGKKKEGSKKS